jgi:serine/threonine-protein kinase
MTAFAGALGVALITALALWAPWRSPPAPAPRTLLASIGADASLSTISGASAILSPDGTTLAFVATEANRSRLYIRKLDQLQAGALAGTEDADSPFMSPDSQWIAFFASGKLKKVAVTGGAAVNLCDAPNARGGTWADDDTIFFTSESTSNTTLMRVSAAGGTPAAFGTLSKGAVTQRWPQALPGGKAVLYSEHSSQNAWGDRSNLVVAPLSGGTPKVVVRGGYYGRYVPSVPGSPTRAEREGGHLVYVQQSTLFAVRFDLDRLETIGQAVPALEGLASNMAFGSAQLALSSDGTLVYVPGLAATTVRPIDWLTRDGKTSVLHPAKAHWVNPRFSPDGHNLALGISDGKQSDIWVYEWALGRRTQLTYDKGSDLFPVWTPDGQRIVFASDRAKAGIFNLYWVNADGTGEVKRLTDSPEREFPWSWHPSGEFLAFQAFRGDTGWDLMILPMEGMPRADGRPASPGCFRTRRHPSMRRCSRRTADGLRTPRTKPAARMCMCVRSAEPAGRGASPRCAASIRGGPPRRTSCCWSRRVKARSWPCRTPSSASPSAPARRSPGRRPTFGATALGTTSTQTASGSRRQRPRSRPAAIRTRSSSSSTSSTTCARSRREPHKRQVARVAQCRPVEHANG